MIMPLLHPLQDPGGTINFTSNGGGVKRGS